VKTHAKLLSLTIAAIGALCLPAVASADFSISTSNFETSISTTQAGAHPDLRTRFTLDDGSEGTPRHIVVKLPTGLLGAANATPTCSMALAGNFVPSSLFPRCPRDTIVGQVEVRIRSGRLSPVPVYNVTPAPGEQAALGFSVVFPVRLDVNVRTDGDYGLTTAGADLTEADALISSDLTLWGVPADHNGVGPLCIGVDGFCWGAPNTESGVKRLPFLNNPTRCTGSPLNSSVFVDTWQDINVSAFAEGQLGPITGCDELEFEPSLQARPTTNAADSPSGLDVDLKIPQNQDPDGLIAAQLRNSEVTLPEGLVINPSSANGRKACSPSQIGYTGASNERQSIHYDPDTTTAYTVAFKGQSTAPLPAGANLAEVTQALEGLPGLAGNIGVSGYPGDWTVVFTGALAGTDVPQLSGTSTNSSFQALEVNGTGGGYNLQFGGEDTGASFEATFGAGTTVLSEVANPSRPLKIGERIAGPGIAPGTKITNFFGPTIVLIDTPTTSAQSAAALETVLPFDASAEELQSILAALPSIGKGNVIVRRAGASGSSRSFRILFAGTLAGSEDPIAVTSNLSGPGAGATVTAAPKDPQPLLVSTQTEAGIPRFNLASPTCPDASRLGDAEIETPLLDPPPLKGSIYLASPQQNPFGSLLAIYLVVEGHGLVVKLAGKVIPDPQTGRLTAVFDENPQVTFEDLRLHFDGGAYAPLKTPSSCGKYATTSVLTPWSAPYTGPPATPRDEYEIAQGPNGAPCGGAQPNAPSFEAGTTAPLAGQYRPFIVNLKREEGTQQFASLSVSPPPGLVAKLAGTQPCSDAALAAAAAKTGAQEQASPSCPAASEVGTVYTQAGAGPSPFNAPGKAYISGPYKGAPISLAVITPAVAGPFDLGTIVVRAALQVDPKTAQVKAVSDPIPTILQGIPLDIRSVSLRLDRPDFTLNPTSCDPTSVDGTLLSSLGSTASLQSRFQLAECGQLKFKPQLSLSLKGGTKRGQYPALTAVLKARPGDANISAASVALPHSEFLAQNHIGTVCTRVQFAASACPARSVYGKVSVTTPLLDYPLSGPVYLRSSDNKLPDLVLDLKGPDSQPIRFEAAGRTDSVNGGIRNSFDFVPDVPFTKLVLQLQGGKKGLLENSRNICTTTNKAAATYTAHNGLAYEAQPKLAVKCGGKAKKKAKGKGKGKAHRSSSKRG
jgi:hypothetical protein